MVMVGGREGSEVCAAVPDVVGLAGRFAEAGEAVAVTLPVSLGAVVFVLLVAVVR